MELLKEIRSQAKRKKKKIVLPEADDERVLKAAGILSEEKIATPILVGDEEKITEKTSELGIEQNGLVIIDPEEHPRFGEFVDIYFEKRKHKGISKDQARENMLERNFFGTMLVEKGLADGCLSGAATPTGDVLRPALHIIGTAEGVKTVSSDILMILSDDQVLSFADCAVIPDPTPGQLADIAIATAETHRKLVREEPKVAMLSFSTKGSARHEKAEKVIRATEIVKEKSDILVDGELQADAAIVESVGERKAPGSQVAGHANVLVFPDLQAANISYKLVQRIAKIEAVGPIIQGLAKPMNDLSRGCSVDDIVNVSAILCNLS
jgi:phosphate acetyltransferase